MENLTIREIKKSYDLRNSGKLISNSSHSSFAPPPSLYGAVEEHTYQGPMELLT